MKKIYLEFVAGSSAKFYRLTQVKSGITFTVLAEWGRIGTKGQSQVKYSGDNEAMADKAFAKAEADKRKGGYVDAADPTGNTVAVTSQTSSSTPVSAKKATPSANLTPVAGQLPSELRFPAQNAGEGGDLAEPIRHPDKFAVEEKFDGIRALIAFLPNGKIEIRNRYGETKGRQAPFILRELETLLRKYPDLKKGTVLDGEIAGVSWNQTMHLLASQQDGLKFYCFDVPILAGKDLRNEPWTVRRKALEQLFAKTSFAKVEVSRLLKATPTLLDELWQAGREGVIYKDVTSRYIPGDRHAWSKVKEVQTAEGVIMGFTKGQGKYSSSVGAVIVGQYRNGKLVEVGQLSGMTDALRNSFDASWIGRVVEFKYNQRTANSYRLPRWLKERTDKKATDCKWE